MDILDSFYEDALAFTRVRPLQQDSLHSECHHTDMTPTESSTRFTHNGIEFDGTPTGLLLGMVLTGFS